MGLIPAPAPAPLPDPPSVTILTYHTFDSAKITPYTVDTARFNEQMRYLSVQRVPVVSLAEVAAHIREGKPLPPHAVVITVDDGYVSALTRAAPVLARYGFPWTLYVYPAAIGRYPSALTWKQLAILRDAGVDIQSHTMTHPMLTHPPRVMTAPEYDAWLDNELRGSREVLERKLGRPVRHLAYSYGAYNERVVARAEAAGYWTATTCDPGVVTRRTAPLLLNRRLVFHDTPFRQYVDLFRTRELRVVRREPRNGESLRTRPTLVAGQILNRDQIRPETLQVRMDHVRGGWKPLTMDARTGRWTFRVPPVQHRGAFYVQVRARDRSSPDSWRLESWMFLSNK